MYAGHCSSDMNFCIQSFLTDLHTFVPQGIVWIIESILYRNFNICSRLALSIGRISE